MQIFSTFIIATLTLAGYSSAHSCTTGLRYCGSSLTGQGNYHDIVGQLLHDRGNIVDDPNDILFYCYGDWSWGQGLIDYIENCGHGNCEDGGSGHSDFCSPSAREESGGGQVRIA